jgi:ribonuclease HI
MYCKTDADNNSFSAYHNTMKIDVFTDGACTKNGQRGARASFAFWIPDHKDVSRAGAVPASDPQTNNRGELMAISEAVMAIAERFDPSDVDVHIFTDSQYSKNCLTVWLPGWVQRGWKTSSGTDVMNRDLIEEAVGRLAKYKSYIISYVAAHTGRDDVLSQNNHIVDRMAARVLSPDLKDDTKVVSTNTQTLFEDFPVKLLGPAVAERSVLDWCRNNLDKLDADALDAALLSAIGKTAVKSGFKLEKQKLRKTAMLRLIPSTHLIAEGVSIVKQE